MKEYSFERLEAYQLARYFASKVYLKTQNFPSCEKYGLTSQLRRAAISIASNLAEGSGRISGRDKAHFTAMSYSSLLEVLCQIQIAVDISYLSDSDYLELREQIQKLSAYLSKLRKYQLSLKT